MEGLLEQARGGSTRSGQEGPGTPLTTSPGHNRHFTITPDVKIRVFSS